MLITNLIKALAQPSPWQGKFIKRIGMFLLGPSMLWWVALNAGPRTGNAVVHVVEPNVEVTVGRQTFRLDKVTYEPLVVELPVGEHRLVMKRNASVLFDNTFKVRGGDDVVLSAWNASAYDIARKKPPTRPPGW